MPPCRCCCPQINVVNNSPSATTCKVSPSGGIVWWVDSGHQQNGGCLVNDQYFALGVTYSGGVLSSGRMMLLGLDGSLFNDTAVQSGAEIDMNSGNNTGVGAAGLSSGGVAFVGELSTTADTARVSFWDVNGDYTGSWDGSALEIASDIAGVGDSACVRMDPSGGGVVYGYRWISSAGVEVGNELDIASGGDASNNDNIVSFGDQVLACGTFDSNNDNIYTAGSDDRYRFYGNSGPPKNSGIPHTTGDSFWATRYGTNSYALCVPQVSITEITKITTGGSVSRNSITGFSELAAAVRDAKETSNGDLVIASNVTIYCYAQSGGAPLWTASLSNIRRLACDHNGNTYAWTVGGTLTKYDSSGSLQWTVTTFVPTAGPHIPNTRPGIGRHASLHVDSSGNAYVTGTRRLAANLG